MIIFWIILIWNAIVFLMYGIDKWRAKNDVWRISEKTLLLSAILFGALGAACGMIVFHHKIAKPSFRTIVPFSLLLHVGGLLYFSLDKLLFLWYNMYK